MTPDSLRILPELILTGTGVAVMLADASLPQPSSRKPLGWLAALGTVIALCASVAQAALPVGTAFYGTVQTDAFSAFFHTVICAIVLVAILLSIDALPADQHHRGEYFALMVFGAVGMCLLTSAIELLVVFIALEISSISTYVLAGYRKHTAQSPESAIKYFLLGSFATAFLLYGIAMLFGATGTTQIPEIATLLASARSHMLVLLAFALMMVGVLFKVSAAPFHVWTPDVYEGAPTPVVALMSTAPKIAAFALLVRLLYGAFPLLHTLWMPLFWVVAILSMTVGNLAALRQTSAKRMLAYSSIAHAGYLLAALAGSGTQPIASIAFYTAAYAAMNVGIFAMLSLVSGPDEHRSQIADFRGVLRQSPLAGGLMLLFLISLIGIPFTGGFFAKFYSFSTAMNGGAAWLTLIGLVNSGIAAAYYLRLAIALAQPAAKNGHSATLPRWTVATSTTVLAAALITLVLGIAPTWVLGAATAAAHSFAGFASF